MTSRIIYRELKVRATIKSILCPLDGVTYNQTEDINTTLSWRFSMTHSRVVRAPRGTQLTCKNWLSEAAYRMIQNNLDPEVAEKPEELVVYGGRGKRRARGKPSMPSSSRSRIWRRMKRFSYNRGSQSLFSKVTR